MSYQKKYEVQPIRNRSIHKPKAKANVKHTRFPKTPFTANVMDSTHIDTRNKDVTGYVKREVYMRDSNGNVQVAREVQVLNSWKKIGYFSTDN